MFARSVQDISLTRTLSSKGLKAHAHGWFQNPICLSNSPSPLLKFDGDGTCKQTFMILLCSSSDKSQSSYNSQICEQIVNKNRNFVPTDQMNSI